MAAKGGDLRRRGWRVVSDDIKKKYPNLEKFWPYVDVLNGESQRGKVLVSAGFLEEHLKQILLAFLVDCPQTAELIDGGNAPLGSFGARITACYVLGLITKDEHDDLQLVRRIRNDFAHDIHTTFDRQSVANRCRELKHRAKDNPATEANLGPMPPASQFHTAAVALIMNLTNRPHYVRQQKCKSAKWPY